MVQPPAWEEMETCTVLFRLECDMFELYFLL